MDKIMEKLNKLSLPAVILIASIVLGGFYYASQLNKQQSIEKQQQIKIEQERQETEAKAEQDKRDYIAKRKTECLAIYKAESDKWNNTESWNYIEPAKKPATPQLLSVAEWKAQGEPKAPVNTSALYNNDKCEIIYENNKYNEEICEEKWKATYDYKNNTEYKLNVKRVITECNETFSKYF